MATTTENIRQISDLDPSGHAVVTVKRVEEDGLERIEIEQDSERVWMSIDHAIAAHAALGLCIDEAVAAKK